MLHEMVSSLPSRNTFQFRGPGSVKGRIDVVLQENAFVNYPAIGK